MSKYPLVFFLFLVLNSLSSQTLAGVVLDEENAPVAGLLINLNHPKFSMVSYGQVLTDSDGRFSFACQDWPSARLTISSNFYVLSEPITVKCPDEIEIKVSYQSRGMDEVIVRGEAIPIIDKGDTLIYNVEKLKQASDMTIEDMLKRLPNISISDDGQVSFRGRKIDRILINGESLTLDHALMTRTLTPEMLAKMEIRTKENNDNLKERLLDESSLLVLDLELEEKVNEKFFGRISVDAGTQNNRLRPNGSGNGFTLQPKTNGLFFINWDHFNRQDISGDQLRELDPTSYNKIFDLPANPELLKRRETYYADLYGFENFYRREPQIVGSSFTFKPAEKLKIKAALFYASDHTFRAESQQLQIIGEETRVNFRDRNLSHKQVDFKSRIVSSFKFNDKSWLTAKMFLSSSTISDDEQLQIASTAPYQFQDTLTGLRGDIDIAYEYKSNNDWGLSLGYHYFNDFNKINNQLSFQDTAYTTLFFPEVPLLQNEYLQVRQKSRNKTSNHSLNVSLRKNWKNLVFSISDTWMFNDIDIRNNVSSPNGELDGNRNWSGTNKFNFARQKPKISLSYYGPFLRLGANMGIDQILTFNTVRTNQNTVPFFGGFFGMNLTNHENFIVRHQQSPSDLPIRNIGTGIKLESIDTWVLPIDEILVAMPQSNTSFSLKSSRFNSSIGLDIEITGVRGSVNNANSLRAELTAPLFQASFFDLQYSTYTVGGLFLEWHPKKRPTTLVKWQSTVFQNRRENGENLDFSNRIFINALEFSTSSKKLPIDLDGAVFLRSFFVKPPNANFEKQQQTISTKFSLVAKLLNDRILPIITYRSIEQLDGQLEPLRTLDFHLRYKRSKRVTFYFEANNMLDQNQQLRIEGDPIRIARSEVALLPASFRLGLRALFL